MVFLSHNLVTNREPQSGTLAHGFGRKERIENSRSDFFGDADAIIRNDQPDSILCNQVAGDGLRMNGLSLGGVWTRLRLG